MQPEGIHLTLKFLGDIEATQVEAVTEAMVRASMGCSPFQLQLAPLGVFPNLQRMRIIWAGVAGQLVELACLQSRVEEQLESLGFPRERRPFSPHLTLGRVREGARPPDAAATRQALEVNSPDSPVSWQVEQVCLVQSTRLPSGARYDTLETASLKLALESDQG